MTVIYDASAKTIRRCGDCQLCCKLLPVRELAKGAGEKCKHQRFNKGCLVYHRPDKGFPVSCALWNCAWLGEAEETANLSRPDRAHYVIDVMPDFVTIDPGDGSGRQQLPVIQVWIDPHYPDAHRDPHLRAYLALRAEREHCAALIRSNAKDGFVLFPPALAADGQWHEKHSTMPPVPTHTAKEVFSVVSAEITMRARP